MRCDGSGLGFTMCVLSWGFGLPFMVWVGFRVELNDVVFWIGVYGVGVSRRGVWCGFGLGLW